MRPKPQNLWHVLRETVSNWDKHGATTHSAALAYLSLFSLAPVLVLVVAVSGWAFGVEAARGQVARELARFIGPEGAAFVQEIVAASAKPRTGRLAAAVGAATLLLGATAALIQLQDTLNTIWEVVPKPGFFLKRLLKKRLLCFLLILSVGGLLLTSLAASAGLAFLQRLLEARLEVGLATLIGGADVALSWLLMTALIALVYRILPDVQIGWREVAWGSGLTAILFLIGKYAIGFYLQRTGLASTYGAAGSLVLILVWIYYSSLIFLLGAEFTRVHSRRYREGRAAPEPGAQRMATIKVPLEGSPPDAKQPANQPAEQPAAHRWIALGIGLTLCAAPLQAARLKVEVEGVRRELERNIRSVLSIEQIDKDELTEERIRRLHADAPAEIEEALQPFGHYRPVVRSELRQEGEQWIARYEVDAGPPIRVASVDLRILGAGGDDAQFRRIAAGFPVKKGEALFHPDYDQGKQALENLAAEEGYLDAAFKANQVRVDLERYRADVILHYDTGPRYRFGEVRFNQNVVEPELLIGYINFERGEPLDVNKVLELQNALSDSPYWSRVEVVTRQDRARGLEVPIDVDLVPSKTMRFSGGVGYGTDTGARVSGAWELRRLNRRGHRGEAEVRASGIEQSVKMSYLIPGAYPRTDVLSFNTAYKREDTDTSLSETGLIGSQLTRSRGDWRESFSLTYQREDFEVGLDNGVVNLLVPGASWEKVEADDRIFATRGYRLLLAFQGAEGSLLSDASFLQGRVGGKYIRTLGERGRIIGRAEVGYTATDEFRELPPTFRFFAGGDRSVRGFGYQSLGREDEAGNVIGGESLMVGSVEYEQWFPEIWGQKLGAAIFYDTGNASQSFGGILARGAGVGARWRSPIGPIRADIAWALSEEGRPIRFHLNIGPDL